MKFVIRGALLALAGASLSANVLLCLWLIAEYREEQAVRLDPTGRWQSPGPSYVVRAADDAPMLAMLGDSRIEGWRPALQVDGCTTLNAGIAGQTTAQTLLRVDEVLSRRPSVVIIQVGINDLKTIGLWPQDRQEIVDNCRKNLDRLVRRITESGSRAVVLTIWPVGPIELQRRPVWSDQTLAAREEVNRWLLSLEGRPGVTVVDCDAVLAEGGRMKREYARDALHLNDAGYAAMNAMLRRVCADLPGRAAAR